jgi:glycosyltransferase involved in cell wall biosynthesis
MIRDECKNHGYPVVMRMISVIVPIYKVESYLRTCLDSLLHQTLEDIEIILVNDGSPDKSPEICDEYARKYANITVLHQENAGLSQARNAGLDVARGEYIGFVDSDDAVDERMYAVLLDLIERHEADISFCAITRISDKGSNVVNGLQSGTDVLSGDEALIELFLRRMSCSVWSKLFKRETIRNLKFLPSRTNEDFPFLVEALLRASRVAASGEGLYHYYLREGSITQSGFNQNQFDKFINSREVFRRIASARPGIRRHARAYHCLQTFNLLKSMLLEGYDKQYPGEFNQMLRSLRRAVFSIPLFSFWPLHHRLSKIYLALFPRIYARRHSGKG